MSGRVPIRAINNSAFRGVMVQHIRTHLASSSSSSSSMLIAISSSSSSPSPSSSLSSQQRSMSRWSHVEMGPKDPILGVTEAFLQDSAPRKFNLGVGAYRDDNGKPTVLKSVKEAVRRIHEANMDNEYAPIAGIKEFVTHAVKLGYGSETAPIKEKRYAAIQSLSGTGALRIAGEFVAKFKPMPVYLPNPTWGNHIPIFKDSGLEVRHYRYYDPKTKGLDLKGLLEDVQKAPNDSMFLFHVCAHNPTGVDPKPEQWAEISAACKKKNHFVLMDFAYQGFASGDPERDGISIRQFIKDGHQLAVCQSFAKNFGLYGQRVGCVSFIVDSPEEGSRVESQLKIIARPIYSNPPIHGARIVATVLGDAQLSKQWRADVKEMADRIIFIREKLVNTLKAVGSKHAWNHITDQIGMFCYSGLTASHVSELMSKHHVYLTSNGRISLAGISSKDVEPIATAIHEVTKNQSSL